MPSITVCKNCTDRELGCHDRCERYQSEKKETEKQKTVYRFHKQIERELRERQNDRIVSMTKHRRGRKK